MGKNPRNVSANMNQGWIIIVFFSGYKYNNNFIITNRKQCVRLLFTNVV